MSNKIFQHSQKISKEIFSSFAQAWSRRMSYLDKKGESVA